jgi:hypothetical protein
VSCREVDLLFTDRSADVPGDVQVVVVLFDFRHAHAARVTLFLSSLTVGVHDLLNVPIPQLVLPLALLKMFRSVDEQWPSFSNFVRMRSSAPPRNNTPCGRMMAITSRL